MGDVDRCRVENRSEDGAGTSCGAVVALLHQDAESTEGSGWGCSDDCLTQHDDTEKGGALVRTEDRCDGGGGWRQESVPARPVTFLGLCQSGLGPRLAQVNGQESVSRWQGSEVESEARYATRSRK